MAILLNQSNKPEVLNLLRQLCQATMYKHLTSEQIWATEQNFGWMRGLAGDFTLQVKLNSEPALSTMEFSFKFQFANFEEPKS
jgi:hypothetical protein